MQTSQDDWKVFFRGAQIVLNATTRADRLLRSRLGSGFNIFDWIKPDENMLSNMVQDLLNPKGTHGQGSAFLQLALDYLIPTPDLVTTDQVESCFIVREALTSNGRFIDLVIDFGTCAIGIENKPFAAEQNTQLADYAYYLHQRFGGQFCLVFLHGPGKQAASLGKVDKERLKAQGRFLEIPYHAERRSSLHGWLIRCATATRSEKIRLFLEDFADYVAKTFVFPNGDVV